MYDEMTPRERAKFHANCAHDELKKGGDPTRAQPHATLAVFWLELHKLELSDPPDFTRGGAVRPLVGPPIVVKFD